MSWICQLIAHESYVMVIILCLILTCPSDGKLPQHVRCFNVPNYYAYETIMTSLSENQQVDIHDLL